MKMLIITPTALMGGTERFMLNFIKVFGKNNSIDVAFYKDTDKRVLDTFSQLARRVIILPYYVKKPWAFLKETRSLYLENNYDYIYIHANHAIPIVYALMSYGLKTKILYHSHNTNGKDMFLHSIGRMIINKVCDEVYACSKDASIYMYGHENAHIIKNGIDLNEYRYNQTIREKMRHELNLSDKYVVGNIGRFNKQKNHDLLIAIFQELLMKDSSARLILIGDGEEKMRIEQKAIEMGIRKEIIFIDTTDRANDFYQCFDLFLLPSLYEGFPFVGVEAQASGTPCLFSDAIPKNIKLTPLVYFNKLEDSTEKWVKQIIDIKNSCSHKKDYMMEIENAGYGLKSMMDEYKLSGLNFN